MIFRRFERLLTQMKTEGFTIKLKDQRNNHSGLSPLTLIINSINNIVIDDKYYNFKFYFEYIPGIEPDPSGYEPDMQTFTPKYFSIFKLSTIY